MLRSIVRILSIFIFLIASSAVQADSWAFKKEVKKFDRNFGDTTIVWKRDTTQNARFPKFSFQVFLKDKLQATHTDLGFSKLFSSPDHRFFLGVSNSGLTPNAFVIFDNEGKLLEMKKHRWSDDVHYCFETSTTVREWFDKENPDPKFTLNEAQKLERVSIRGCNGTIVRLPVGDCVKQGVVKIGGFRYQMDCNGGITKLMDNK